MSYDVYYNKNAGYGNTNPDDTNYLKIYDTCNASSLVCTKRKLLRCSQLQRVEYNK